MVKLIHQRTYADCVIAALSTYCGKEYEETYRSYKLNIGGCVEFDGVNVNDIPKLAKGLKKNLIKRKSKPKGKGMLVVRFNNNDIGKEICGNNSEWYHAVYFDGLNIFDPAKDGSIANCLTTNQYLKKTVYWFSEKKWWEL